jgi:hypothetical protein
MRVLTGYMLIEYSPDLRGFEVDIICPTLTIPYEHI